jgi:predicted unusual protein kinase regulating ubiquinone biosynthesis (AarF/ABC1/UbiB family)
VTKDRAIPTGRFARMLPLLGLAGRSALDASRGVVHRFGNREKARAATEARVARLAERYATVLGGMKGAAMKAGQLISFVDAEGLVPGYYQRAFQESLRVLQDSVPPMTPAEARDVFTEEIGSPPERVFAHFSPEPVAAASIGQVHRARLRHGPEVAVKIQYPGAAEAVRSDLANTQALISFVKIGQSLLGDKAPRLDPRAVVEEVRDRIAEELDYRVEAGHQQRFCDLYAGHPFVHVPAVHPELSGRRVLTMDFVDGLRWTEAIEQGADLRQRWGEVVYRFVFTSLNRHGLFNGDPHPGNYLFHADGTVSFVDFGCVKHFDEDHIELFSRLNDAAIGGDAPGLVRAFLDVGMLSPEDAGIDAQRLLEYYRLQLRCIWDDQPFAFTPEYAAEVVSSTYDVLGPWGDVASKMTMPKDLVFLNRVVIGLFSILGRLGATADWRAIDREVRHHGPPATDLGRAEAAWLARQH